MPTSLLLILGGGMLALLVLLALLGQSIRHQRQRRQQRIQEAINDFPDQRTALAEAIVQAIAVTGKPRGLRCYACELGREVLPTMDTQTGQVWMLAPAVLHYQALPGSDMEDNPNVGLPRQATVVFRWADPHWQPTGAPVMNLTPWQTLEQFAKLKAL